ncbi:MAG: hypothetical protein WCL28_13150 [bacterium]
MANLTVITANLIVASILVACVTTSKKNLPIPAQSSKQTSAQAIGQSTAETIGIARTNPGMKQVPQAIAADAEYSAFFARLVFLENDYTEKDRQILRKIPAAPSGGTIHEAALVVGLLRDVLTPIGVSSRLPDTESPSTRLDSRGNMPTPTATSKFVGSRAIELRAQGVGLDLIGALANNPYLKGRTVYKMAFDALMLGGNSPIFTDNLRATIQSESAGWGQFAIQLGTKGGLTVQDNMPAPANGTTDAQGGNNLTLNSQSNTSQAVSATAGLTSGSALLLAKAQELAAKDQIEQAITTAKMVPESSETYSVAKLNIKTWSDRATQDLRKQAANQYRASSGTPDSNGKKVYLSKARTLLEEALTKYPDSSNLETIKENLEIINQELNRLE